MVLLKENIVNMHILVAQAEVVFCQNLKERPVSLLNTNRIGEWFGSWIRKSLLFYLPSIYRRRNENPQVC